MRADTLALATQTCEARTANALRDAAQAGPRGGFVRLREEAALAQARAVDRQLAQGVRAGRLQGAPLAHKDMFFRNGELSECGSRILADHRSMQTATVLQRFDAAGAIDLGALHMAEFAMSPTGFNAHLGHGRNAWSDAHVSGGSSSGSGIAVARGLVAGALGSDTGGSVRIPAAANGVTGIKPTQHAISVRGVMPLSPSLDCVGVLARTAQDAAALLQVIWAADPHDPHCLATGTRDFESAIEQPLTHDVSIAVPAFDDDAPVSDEVRAALMRVADALACCGATIRRVAVPDLREAGALATLVLGAEAASVHAKWLRERRGDYGAQVLRRLERGLLYPATRYVDALRLRAILMSGFVERYLSGAQALLLPTLPYAVPTIEETLDGDADEIERRFGNFSYWTRGINYLGLPSISVPAGKSGNGMPVGVQLIGRPWSEDGLLRVAHQLQRSTDWHLRSIISQPLGTA
ncbi:amidase [Paraburkholderia susongensis]|uniref:Aspartyl/glutamyl-tRNA(Asn/Gln) amidotransferase subunit A n=1 Tax=Paraburkholderia susongensis TaxID=1515439 RepID=A0A1X7M094_9BURK|nr:amidase [Paraburkholderia susongensis]SMG58932.1 aspartyl/glutamyl-tRNA(Asn/Gln) amidotransferase subunit A [Paraburkholderia susongensis]